MNAAGHVQGLNVFPSFRHISADEQVANGLEGIHAARGAVEDLSGELRPLEHSPGQEQCSDLGDPVRNIGDRIVALHGPPELLVIQRQPLLGHPSEDRRSDEPATDGHGLHESRRGSVEPQHVR